MPASITCPSCGRVHTPDEYDENRFCRSCGALLEVRAAGHGDEAKGWRTLFPYEPYPQQVDFMGDVERIVGRGGILVAEACNGFGKTVSALSVLLGLGRQIVYTTRTHDQVRQVLQEVERINRHAGAGFTAVNLASREFLCLNPDCRGAQGREAQEICNALRKDDKCSYRSEILEPPPGLPPILTPKALSQAGRRLMICPYFLARRAARTRRLVVAPYPYVFDPRIRMMTGLDLEGRLLVLDEGHNIDQVGQETLSDTLSNRTLETAAEEVKAIGGSRAHMRRLSAYLDEEVGDEPRLKRAEELESGICAALGSDLTTFTEHYAPMVDKIRERKLRRGEPPVSYLSGVLAFMELLASSRKDRYVAICRRGSYGSDQVEYRCLDPSLALKPIVESASGTLIMSGTLSPLKLFAETLGLGGAELRSYPSIQSLDSVRMVVDTRVTSAYRERSDEMMLRIGEIVANGLEKVPSGALVFFPQRELMGRCLDAWGVNGVVKVRGGTLHLGGKQLFREGADARQNEAVLERYRAAALTPPGAVLACVFRGRNSEGSNFPDEQARGIFLVGVPYANYGDPVVRAQIAYYDRGRGGMGQRWYTMDAFRAANQALGRGIRSREDWCHYWLLDARYAANLDLISAWAKGRGPEIVTDEPRA